MAEKYIDMNQTSENGVVLLERLMQSYELNKILSKCNINRNGQTGKNMDSIFFFFLTHSFIDSDTCKVSLTENVF